MHSYIPCENLLRCEHVFNVTEKYCIKGVPLFIVTLIEK